MARAKIEPETPSPRSRETGAHRRLRTERDYLRALVEAVKASDVADVVRKVLAQAKAGDKDARAWIGRYVLGNGKVPLDDVRRQPVIRPRRGR